MLITTVYALAHTRILIQGENGYSVFARGSYMRTAGLSSHMHSPCDTRIWSISHVHTQKAHNGYCISHISLQYINCHAPSYKPHPCSSTCHVRTIVQSDMQVGQCTCRIAMKRVGTSLLSDSEKGSGAKQPNPDRSKSGAATYLCCFE